MAAKRRIVVTFGLVSGLRVSKVPTVTGIRGGRGRETQDCRHFWTRLGSSRLKSANSHKDREAVVSKRRTVVTFGLVSFLRVSKMSTVAGIPGGRETQNYRHFWTRLGSSRRKSANSHKDPGGSWSRNVELSSLLDSSLRVSKVSTVRGIRGRETYNCRHFWTRLGSSRLKSVNSHRDRGGRGRETYNCRHFWTRLGSSRLKSANSHRDRGGRGCETQNCRHFWTRLGSLRLKNVNSHRDPGGSWSRNAGLSSLLDSSRVFESQKCQQSQGSGGRGLET